MLVINLIIFLDVYTNLYLCVQMSICVYKVIKMPPFGSWPCVYLKVVIQEYKFKKKKIKRNRDNVF